MQYFWRLCLRSRNYQPWAYTVSRHRLLVWNGRAGRARRRARRQKMILIMMYFPDSIQSFPSSLLGSSLFTRVTQSGRARRHFFSQGHFHVSFSRRSFRWSSENDDDDDEVTFHMILWRTNDVLRSRYVPSEDPVKITFKRSGILVDVST